MRIDIVHLSCDDQGIHEGGAVTTTLGASEEPGLPAKLDTAQRPLRRIVRQADLRDLAQRAVGCSTADVDAVIRQTRAMARGQKRDMTLDDLQNVFRITHDPAIDRRVALHECGHAIICAALRLGPVRRVFLNREGGGGTVFDTDAKHGLLSDMQDRLVQLLAGRAAERLVLGDVSAGAGGGQDSDLAHATMIATSIQTRYGLGAQGPVWTADPETQLVLDPDTLFRVKRELENAENRAIQILTVHRSLLEEMAEALAASRDMDRAEVEIWLACLRNAAPDEGQKRATSTAAIAEPEGGGLSQESRVT